MQTTVYATFANAGEAVRAAGALLDHGIAAEQISAILPPSPSPAPLQNAGGSEERGFIGRTETIAPDFNVPAPPPVPALPSVPEPPPGNDQARRTANAPGYHYDALGAVIPDRGPTDPAANSGHSVPPGVPAGRTIIRAASVSTSVQARTGTEPGSESLSQLEAVTLSGIGLVLGTGTLASELRATTALAGDVAGSVYGCLIDLKASPETARLLSDHLQAGKPILSVDLSGEGSEREIRTLLERVGAALI